LGNNTIIVVKFIIKKLAFNLTTYTKRNILKFSIILLISVTFVNLYAGTSEKVNFENKLTEFFEHIRDHNYHKAYEKDIEIRYSSGHSSILKISRKQTEFTKEIKYIMNDMVLKNIPSDFHNKLIAHPYKGYYYLSQENTNIYFYTGKDNGDSKIWILIRSSSFAIPSFNCKKAYHITEKEICRIPYLSDLDNELHHIYSLAKKNLIGLDHNNLKNNQISFMTRRNKCENNHDCISSTISKRIEELKFLVEDIDKKSFQLKDINYDYSKVLKQIQGEWNYDTYISAATCGGEYEYQKDILSVNIKNNNINIKFKSNEKLECTIKNKIYYFNTWAYSDNYTHLEKNIKLNAILNFDYGSCGGNENDLLYKGYFLVLDTDKCGKFALTGHELNVLAFPRMNKYEKVIESNNNFGRDVTFLKK